MVDMKIIIIKKRKYSTAGRWTMDVLEWYYLK